MGLINLNSNNTITCLNDLVSSIKAFVFGGSPNTPTMEIVQGADTLLSISLSDLFITLNDYTTQEFKLKSGAYKSIDGGNIASMLGEVQFLAILVTYPAEDTGNVQLTTDDYYIKYSYPAGAGQLNIGKIMILTGSTLAQAGWDFDSSPGALVLFNPHNNFDVSVKVLAFN
jgi:hypothetical protein